MSNPLYKTNENVNYKDQHQFKRSSVDVVERATRFSTLRLLRTG